MSDQLALFCLVEGQSTSQAFEVTVGRNANVSGLKDAIKKKKEPEFDDFAADRLTLWRVLIPITDDDDTRVTRDMSSDKKPLGPSTRFSKFYPEGTEPPEDTVHILIQPPAQAASTPESAGNQISLGIIDRRAGRKHVCLFSTNTKSVTLEQLRSTLAPHFENLSDGSEIYYHPVEGKKPICLTNDADDDLIHIGRNTCQGFDIEPKTLDKNEEVVLKHIVDDCRYKNDVYVFLPGASEATKSSIVDTFMVGATYFHKTDLFLAQQEDMSDIAGTGCVDFAVIDRARHDVVLGITEVKREQYEAGIAQNMVQLDVALRQRKRKRPDDEADLSCKSYGVVTDSVMWTLLECVSDSEGALTFRSKTLTNTLVLRNGMEHMETGCRDVFGYLLALFDLMKSEIANRRADDSMPGTPDPKRHAPRDLRLKDQPPSSATLVTPPAL